MNDPERTRFEMLRQGPCISADYLRDFYGLTYPWHDDLRQDFEKWASGRGRVAQCDEGKLSRYEVESFMRWQRVIPHGWMAVRLGMTRTSFQQTLAELARLGMKLARYAIYAELISESLADDLVLHLGDLRHRTFGDHDSFCERLHEALLQELGIQIEPEYCVTSLRVNDQPPRFAQHVDCLTLDPVSVRHQIWLDFRKPLYLAPDCCSKLYFAQNQEVLRPYIAGAQEPDIEDYLQLVVNGHNE